MVLWLFLCFFISLYCLGLSFIMKVRVLGGTNTFKKHKSTNNQWNKHFHKAWRYVTPVEQTFSQSMKVRTPGGTNTFTKHEGTYPRWNKYYYKAWRNVPPVEQTLSQSKKVRTPGGTNTVTEWSCPAFITYTGPGSFTGSVDTMTRVLTGISIVTRRTIARTVTTLSKIHHKNKNKQLFPQNFIFNCPTEICCLKCLPDRCTDRWLGRRLLDYTSDTSVYSLFHKGPWHREPHNSAQTTQADIYRLQLSKKPNQCELFL